MKTYFLFIFEKLKTYCIVLTAHDMKIAIGLAVEISSRPQVIEVVCTDSIPDPEDDDCVLINCDAGTKIVNGAKVENFDALLFFNQDFPKLETTYTMTIGPSSVN